MGLLLMKFERVSQKASPFVGSVSMTFPDIETNLFGLGLSRSLYG